MQINRVSDITIFPFCDFKLKIRTLLYTLCIKNNQIFFLLQLTCVTVQRSSRIV